jgi:hypothetical protein
MNSKIESMRKSSELRFGFDRNESAISSRALDFLEQWVEKSRYKQENSTFISRWKSKRECSSYIEEKLYKAREEEYGFLGGILSAIAFQLIVQVIIKWITSNFFE